MATEDRNQGPALNLMEVERSLEERPQSFSFFQAVRLLRRLRPDRAPPGSFGDPAHEVVRFRSSTSLGFPPSEIAGLDRSGDGPAEMTVHFMGLVGPSGVLPREYTSLAAARVQRGDRALRDFLDLFHHRLLSLFYLAWERNQVTNDVSGPGEDRLSRHVLDLVGAPADPEDVGVSAAAMIHYAGLLAPVQRSAQSLKQLLEDYFDVPVQVEELVGGWFPVQRIDRCELGEERNSSCLGAGVLVGGEVWDPQARIRIRLGPLTKEQHEDFLPEGTAFEPLRRLTRMYTDDRLDVDVQLVMAADQIGAVSLDADAGMRLGWSTWLPSRSRKEAKRDADEAVFTLC